ncbi:MAG: ECF transporter S component [Promethearchaeota archaeon]|nr:MAG: ECF transporter S component [Candidatus Lokiarchaeota archaeon]
MNEESKNETKTTRAYGELRSQIHSVKGSDIIKETEKLQQEENYVHSVWLKKLSFKIALISMFIALSVVLAYILAPFPNIELFTLSIFLGGFILGKKEGLFIGISSSLIFVFLNPYGVSPLPLLTYQIIHYSFTGLAGALTHSLIKDRSFFHPNDLYSISIMILFGFIGAIITFAYDLISSLIGTITIYGTLEAFIPYFLSGVIFTTIHEIGNILGFVFILPGLIQVVYKILY